MSRFIFVRHGQSEANANGTIATADTPLTEAGIEQARKTADKIRNFKITMIVCSPMLRAQQTAETIAGELGIGIAHIKIIDQLRERGFGSQEAKPKIHETQWYYQSDEDPTCEKTKDLYSRMSLCLGKIKDLAQNEKILVVGHGTSGFYLLQIAVGKKSTKEFDPVSQMNNADFKEVKL